MDENSSVVRLRLPDEIDDPLTNILRNGARRLLTQAVEMEAEAFLATMKDLRLPDGRGRVVRRNAAKSTGPMTQYGKLQSRRNAMRHGLTAATVVPAMKDKEEFERFEAAIRADYQPVFTVEHELVARLTSLLWQLRRSTLIETNLFQLQARLAMEHKRKGQGSSDTAGPGIGILYRLLRSPDTIESMTSAPTSAWRHPAIDFT